MHYALAAHHSMHTMSISVEHTTAAAVVAASRPSRRGKDGYGIVDLFDGVIGAKDLLLMQQGVWFWVYEFECCCV